MKRIIGIFFILLILTACRGQDQSSPTVEIDSYRKSELNEEIPVPADAVATEADYSNPYIKDGMKYTFKNIGGEQGLYPPLNYFEELKKWGWEEIENERMGHAHYFQKEDYVISIIVKEDYFTLVEMKDTFNFN